MKKPVINLEDVLTKENKYNLTPNSRVYRNCKTSLNSKKHSKKATSEARTRNVSVVLEDILSQDIDSMLTPTSKIMAGRTSTVTNHVIPRRSTRIRRKNVTLCNKD